MTLNVVLKAKDRSADAITCAEIARRWLATAIWRQVLTWRKLTASGGPLDLVRPDNIDPHRDQPADRACTEIGRAGFSHGLSVEGVQI